MADRSKPRAPFAPWDRRELPGLFPVEESARRVGNYKWTEMRLFEVLGGWVANTGTIRGPSYGVYITGAAGTVTNSGTIQGTSGDGIRFNNGGFLDVLRGYRK